jgi:hypothetical protein
MTTSVGLPILAAAQATPAGRSFNPPVADLNGWAATVAEWIKTSPRDARAHLARGVLLECLAFSPSRDAFSWNLLSESDRSTCGGAPVPMGEDVHPGRVQTVYWSTLLAARGCDRAAKAAFERASQLRPDLDEARLRASYATIRQPRTTPLKNDDKDLLHLLNNAREKKVRFLAALFLGLGAEKRRDLASASQRYQQAREQAPQWASARYALAAILLQQGRMSDLGDALSKAADLADDPWYAYTCGIMTLDIVDELRRRQQK